MIHIIEIIIFGSLLLLSFLLISNPFKVNRKANRWLGFFVVVWALYWIEEVSFLALSERFDIMKYPVLSLLRFMGPIAFYLAVKQYTNPNHFLSKKNVVYLILPSVYLILLILHTSLTYSLLHVLVGLTFFHALVYIIASYIKIRKHQEQIKRFASNTSGIDLYWLEYIIIVMIVVVVLFLIFNILFYEAPLNIIMNVIMLGVVFFIAYNSLRQREIYPIDEQEREDALDASQVAEDEQPKRKLISDERLDEIKTKLNELMIKEEPYLNPELNLINLSRQLQISSNHLSYVINTGYDENFYGYINQFRIEKAKKLLVDKQASHLSIIGVAYESGFSSKTSFNTTFKKMTGLTPSEYKKKGPDL